MKKADIDLSVSIGNVSLANPIMSAAGTAGHGAELAIYIKPHKLGAMVVKSLAPYPWQGHPYPRVYHAPGGMLNGIGLQGPGIEAWIKDYLPGLKTAGAKIIVSIWGKTTAEFGQAAAMLEAVKNDITALELNISCPNIKNAPPIPEMDAPEVGAPEINAPEPDWSSEPKMFSHSATDTAEIVKNTDIGLPRWVKLGPTTPNLIEIATCSLKAGASAITLINTIPAMRIDADKKQPYLSSTTGGFSGPALKSIALKAVYECHKAVPDLPIVGVGGIRSGKDVAEFLLAGASAVQIGTATFLNPKATMKILKDFNKWCAKNKITRARDLTGAAHRHT